MRRCSRSRPISPFRPRRWRGALLPDRARVTVEVLEAEKRPVAAVADHNEVRAVRSVEIRMDHSVAMHMLFDPGHSLDERILQRAIRVLRAVATPSAANFSGKCLTRR